MLDATKIRFQKLRMADLPLMHTWLATDAVRQWYAKRDYAYQQVVDHYAPRITGQAPTDSFLIVYSDTPIGYIQTYKISDYPDYSQYVEVRDDAAGVDLFIGEVAYLHQGLGCLILKRFLREIVFANPAIGSCILGPEPQNKAAIRAYEKAGFRYLKTVQIPDEEAPEYLMSISRNEV